MNFLPHSQESLMEMKPALMISAVRGAEICRERGGDVEEGVGGAVV